MPKLGDPLVYDLPEASASLAKTCGRTNLRKAAMRRGVSGACYAVIHALCFVCASELIGWSQEKDLVEPVYRMHDHGTAKNRMKGREAGLIGTSIVDIGNSFVELQDARNAANYSPPTLFVRQDETLRLIALAAQTVLRIEDLTTQDRMKLAVLLIAKNRAA